MPREHIAEPPQPPDAPRRVRLYPFQWIGTALLALLPVLAVAGVFGESWGRAHAETPTLAVDVRYPTRFRYKQINQIELWIRNRSAAPVDTVRVQLDSTYARQFSTLTAIPPFTQAYELELTRLGPGETRLAIIELQAERYGRHAGALRASGADTATVRLSTFVFP